MDGGGDAFPGGDLVLVVDAGDGGVAACFVGDEGRFCDEEGAWVGGSLLVVFLDHGEERDVFF